ncbi:MAG: hypothetical protein M1837_006404 [Sclerophora amabilis]|nr:MAG: hypothetical protein M1837_006404 [Sclerophora amabilis]
MATKQPLAGRNIGQDLSSFEAPNSSAVSNPPTNTQNTSGNGKRAEERVAANSAAPAPIADPRPAFFDTSTMPSRMKPTEAQAAGASQFGQLAGPSPEELRRMAEEERQVPGNEESPDANGSSSDVDMPDEEGAEEDEEEEKRQQANLYAQGAEGMFSQQPATLPQFVKLVHRLISIQLREVWEIRTSGPGAENTIKKVRDQNQKIVQKFPQNLEYQYPVDEVIRYIEYIVELNDVAQGKKQPPHPLREDPNILIAKAAQTIATGLEQKGINWQYLVKGTILQFLLEKIESLPPQDKISSPEFRNFMTKALAPTNEQSLVLHKADNIMVGAWQDPAKSIDEAALQTLQNELRVENRSLNVNKNDHQLPLEELKRTMELICQHPEQKDLLTRNFKKGLWLHGLPAEKWIPMGPAVNISKAMAEAMTMAAQGLCFNFLTGELEAKASPDTRSNGPTNTPSEEIPNTDGAANNSIPEAHHSVPLQNPNRPSTGPNTQPEGITRSIPRGFVKVGVKFPEFSSDVTPFGVLVAAKEVGRGYRVLVDAGVPGIPQYELYRGSDFGRGMGKNFAMAKPWPETQRLKDRMANHIQSVSGIVQVERDADSTASRAPPTYVLIEWRPAYAWEGSTSCILTRSQYLAICGKKNFELISRKLRAQNASNREQFNDAKRLGVHPLTGQPLTDSDRENQPWLCPDEDTEQATPTNHKNKQARGNGPDVTQPQGQFYTTTNEAGGLPNHRN